MRKRTPWLVLAAFALALTRGGEAVAGDPVAAEALFREGRAAIGRGDYAAACAKLTESYRLDPTAAGTLLNLGECKERLGKLAGAWQHYREAADLLVGDDRREIARQHIAALEPRLPRLTIQLAADAPESTTIVRDGVPLTIASVGVALPVDPGEHRLEVSAPGRATKTFAVRLREAQAETVAVAPGPPVETQSEGPRRSPAPQGPAELALTRRATGFVIGGLGIASLAVGAVTGIITLDRKATVERECPDQACRTPAGTSAASEGRTLGVVSTVTFAAGAAALGVGTALVVWSFSGAPSTSARAPSPRGASVGLVHAF